MHRRCAVRWVMSFYRDTYLKSEDWRNLRAAKLASKHDRCQLCGLAARNNDVHHLQYRNLFDVRTEDLKVLCRFCHDQVHLLLNQYPKLKKVGAKLQWRIVKSHLLKASRRLRDSEAEIRKKKRRRHKKRVQNQRRFFRFLRANADQLRQSTKWKPGIFGNRQLRVMLESNDVAAFSARYTNQTGIDILRSGRRSHSFERFSSILASEVDENLS